MDDGMRVGFVFKVHMQGDEGGGASRLLRGLGSDLV